MTFSELAAPIGLLEHLVNQKYTTAVFNEVFGKFSNTQTLEVEVVHIDIQTTAVGRSKLLFSVLQEEGGLADAPCTLDTYQAVAPVNLIHKITTDCSICVVYQIGMGAEKGLFHKSIYLYRCKGNTYFQNCKLNFTKYFQFRIFCHFFALLKNKLCNFVGNLQNSYEATYI